MDAGIAARKLDQIGSAKFFRSPSAEQLRANTNRLAMRAARRRTAGWLTLVTTEHRNPQSRRKCNCRPEVCLATRRRTSATIVPSPSRRTNSDAQSLCRQDPGRILRDRQAQGTF